MLDFRMGVTLDGEPLSAGEIEALLEECRRTAVDARPLGRGRPSAEAGSPRSNAFGHREARARRHLTFAEAMRLVAGCARSADGLEAPDSAEWAVCRCRRLAGADAAESAIARGLARIDPGPALAGHVAPVSARPGCAGCHLLTKLGLGACLADDMGLGKTIQVLALLLVLKQEQARIRSSRSQPAGGAGLAAGQLGRRKRRAFAPGLALPDRASIGTVAGRICGPRRAAFEAWIWSSPATPRCCACPCCRHRTGSWPSPTRRRRSRTRRRSNEAGEEAEGRHARIALTGTPVENRLSDLWSMFDFTHPGLLGSQQGLRRLHQAAAGSEHFAPLRAAGRALHPAPPEVRQACHRRSARQDRAQRLVFPGRQCRRRSTSRPCNRWRRR
jgi:hypothetical protein